MALVLAVGGSRHGEAWEMTPTPDFVRGYIYGIETPPITGRCFSRNNFHNFSADNTEYYILETL